MLIGESPKSYQGIEDRSQGKASKNENCDVVLVHGRLSVGESHGSTLNKEQTDQGQKAVEEEDWDQWPKHYRYEAAGRNKGVLVMHDEVRSAVQLRELLYGRTSGALVVTCAKLALVPNAEAVAECPQGHEFDNRHENIER